MSRNQSKMNKEKQIFENQISLILREDKTLEIYVGDSLAAEISDGRLDMEFAKEILEGLDYEINESSFTIRPLHTSRVRRSRDRPEISVIFVATSAQAAKSSFPLGLTTGGI